MEVDSNFSNVAFYLENWIDVRGFKVVEAFRQCPSTSIDIEPLVLETLESDNRLR